VKTELQGIRESIVSFNMDDIGPSVKNALDTGCTVSEIQSAIRRGSEEVGRKFENGEYFLSDLIMVGETIRSAVSALKPHIKQLCAESGTIVIGTIQGDLHDIGKDIVATLLTASGFKVFDLGIDVSPKRFVDEANSSGADVVGVSALLTVTLPAIRNLSADFEKAGIRRRVWIIAGGAALSKDHAGEIEVDAAVNDAFEGIELIRSWTRAKPDQGNA
jgi:methylmalonyl-CoA mutase cobalamin-binding domain/chain